ncbi:MAG TPA: class I SAM-dependent methyltransferase [Steroidobacteraceae bacterium]|nr:class I SAM-dependent methyltransferase [Steroidobacteraceae bacterium]
MRAPHENPDLRYVEHTSAGAEYVRQINAREEDRRTRAAFRELVLRIAAPGARLFDFGAGPGIDARYFAEQGFSVDAYDVDPLMREYFVDHCRDVIDSGRVNLETGSYREFLAAGNTEPKRRADLVISNFAPLNLVDDLCELFGTFAALTGPQGRVLASVLNPCFSGELRSRWWWRRAPRLWRDGQLFLPGPQAPHYRRRLEHFRRASGPDFRLVRVFGGLPPDGAHRDGIDVAGAGRLAWLHLLRSRFIFLLFEKTAT